MIGAYVGIDPGKEGAIAVIMEKDENHPKYYDMPLLPNGEVDAKEIRKILESLPGPFCILEKSQVMPNQGAVSGFNYGVGYGTIKATISLCGVPFEEITPQKWKKEFSLIIPREGLTKVQVKKIAKEKAATTCLKMFPLMSTQDFYTPRGRLIDGRAEAILICEYGRRILTRGAQDDLRGNREKI